MQKVLITGASVGIGRQIAIKFASNGANIIINYRVAEDDAKETLRLVEEAGGKGHILQADVSDPKQAETLVQKSAEILGGLDALINNAGATRFIAFNNLDAVDVEDFEFLNRVNVHSVFFCSRAAAKIMERQEHGGSIVNFGSVAGMLPRGSSMPYAVTKSAVLHLTKCLANVLSPKIRVNAVTPGHIQNTRWNAGNVNHDEAKYQAYAQTIPLGRLGEPHDVADAVYFLASKEASFITGVNLPVEGGQNVF